MIFEKPCFRATASLGNLLNFEFLVKKPSLIPKPFPRIGDKSKTAIMYHGACPKFFLTIKYTYGR